MHAILFIEKPPGETNDIVNTWCAFQRNLQKTLQLSTGILRLAEGAWLIPLDSGQARLDTILKAVEKAKEDACKCRVLFVEGELHWLD